MSEVFITRRGGGGSGGSALNFKVIAVSPELTLPAIAKENTIAVSTTAPISSYVFATVAPTSPEEGIVWFATGTASSGEFNAIKKNGLWVYPTACKQYVSGAWVNRDAWIYKSSAWVQFSWAWIYVVQNGAAISPPGFSTFGSVDGTLPVITQGSGYTEIKTTVNSNAITTDSKLDLTNANTIYAELNLVSYTQGSTAKFKGVSLAVFNTTRNSNFTTMSNAMLLYTLTTTKGEQTISLNVSSLTGEYYPAITVPSNGVSGSTVRVKNIWVV